VRPRCSTPQQTRANDTKPHHPFQRSPPPFALESEACVPPIKTQGGGGQFPSATSDEEQGTGPHRQLWGLSPRRQQT
jgi:hypothetical protein